MTLVSSPSKGLEQLKAFELAMSLPSRSQANMLVKGQSQLFPCMPDLQHGLVALIGSDVLEL
jgi:hypothetical protein